MTEKITDLMRIKFGISTPPKSIKVKPDEGIGSKYYKVARWLGSNGLKNGDYDIHDEMDAVQAQNPGATVTRLDPSDPQISQFRVRTLQKGNDKQPDDYQNHVYKIEDPKLDRDMYLVVDPFNKQLNQYKYTYGAFDKSYYFKLANQNLLLGYYKLDQALQADLKEQGLEISEDINDSFVMRNLKNPKSRKKDFDYWVNRTYEDALVYLEGHQATVDDYLKDHGRGDMTDEEIEDKVADMYVKNGQLYYNGPDYYREEMETAKALWLTDDFINRTYNISLAAEKEHEASRGPHAKFFQTKKNIAPGHQAKMEELSDLLKDTFKSVEIDDDTDLEKVDRLVPELKAVSDALPKAANGEKPILRFRKLGTKALGKFTPVNNTVAVDPRELSDGNVGLASFFHEYGHFLDYNSNSVYTMSLDHDYSKILSDIQKELPGMLDPDDLAKLDYMSNPTETFARGFEAAMSEAGVKAQSLLKDREKYETGSRYNYSDTTKQEIFNYFDEKFDLEKVAEEMNRNLEEADKKLLNKEEKEAKLERDTEKISNRPSFDPETAEQLDMFTSSFTDEEDREKLLLHIIKHGEEYAFVEKVEYGNATAVFEDGKKTIASDLAISEKLSDQDEATVRNSMTGWQRGKYLDAMTASNKEDDRIWAAQKGREQDLDQLVNDKEKIVRWAVALRGRDKDLDILVNDKEEMVREGVAQFGRDKDLDVLVHDPEALVRQEVASHNKDKYLDDLRLDPDANVRVEVLKHGRSQDLDILVYDPDAQVRRAVAMQGRAKDLRLLAKDDDKWVREMANEKEHENDGQVTKMAKSIRNQYRLWAAQDGRPQDLDILVHDSDERVRAEVANHGRDQDLDILVNDKDYNVRKNVVAQKREQDLDLLVNDKDWAVRGEVARYGQDKYLDQLVNDQDWQVREQVALRGRDQDLDQLVNDEAAAVRSAVAMQGRDQDLDILVHDKSPVVRKDVVIEGRDKDLDVLVHDTDPDVRQAVAIRAREKDSDILVSDENQWVREAVADYGKEQYLNQLVDDVSPAVREAVAKRGRGEDLDKLVGDKEWAVRCQVAMQGRDKDLDVLVHDKEAWVREAVATQKRDKDLDVLVHDPEASVRSEVARQKRDQDLAILVNDKDKGVRHSVAAQHDLRYEEQLSNDPSSIVRDEVIRSTNNEKILKAHINDKDHVTAANAQYYLDLHHKEDEEIHRAQLGQNEDLDILVHSDSPNVRYWVTTQGRDEDLDKLIKDKDEIVRWGVANQGRDKDLDLLAYDKSGYVRSAVAEQGRDEDLDRLVNDKDPQVRASVAVQGRDKDLAQLLDDPDEVVKKWATQTANEKEEAGRSERAAYLRQQGLDR